jgi:hypothetical protein
LEPNGGCTRSIKPWISIPVLVERPGAVVGGEQIEQVATIHPGFAFTPRSLEIASWQVLFASRLLALAGACQPDAVFPILRHAPRDYTITGADTQSNSDTAALH